MDEINKNVEYGYISYEEFKKKKRKKRLYANYAKIAIATAFISVVSTVTGMAIKNRNNINSFAKNDSVIESYFEDGTIEDNNSYMIKNYQKDTLERIKMLIAQYEGLSIDDYQYISIFPHFEKDGLAGGTITIKGEEFNYKDLNDLERKLFSFAAYVTTESTKNNTYGSLKKEYDAQFVKLIDEVSNAPKKDNFNKSK